MIHKMHALYDYIPQEYIDKFDNEYGLVVEPKSAWKVITLNFQKAEQGFFLRDSILSDYDSSRNIQDYYYRNAPGNSVSPFLSIYITEEGFKLDGEYSTASKDFKNTLKILKNNVEINSDLQGLYDLFQHKPQDIFTEIDKYLSNSKKSKYIFTISIDGLHIGRSALFSEIRKQAAEDYYKDFYTLTDKKVAGENMVCSMCQERQDEIWGYVSIYNFYTSKTELAPIAGGLKKEKAYRNYPVCPVCASKLKKLRPVVDKYFSFKFCGFDYLLIPEVIMEKAKDNPMHLIIELMVAQYEADPAALLSIETRLGDFSIGERKKLIDSYSKEVFDCLAEMNNSVSYTMLFYARSNQEFKILMTIEDVFPSQFREIYLAKEKAEAHEIFRDLRGKEPQSAYNLEFRFDLLKEFFPVADKMEGDFSKTFLEITRGIFTQKMLSYSFILHRIVNIIRRRFANDQNYDLAMRKAFLLLKFLSYLGILNQSKNITQKEVAMTGKYADFFEEHGDFFDSSAKQYIFMTGVLTQYLINIQMHDKGSAPFRKRLNSLKLDKDLVHRIFTEAREKLIQYDKNYYQELEQDIADLMIKGGIESLSNDEISFIFTLGMTLSKKFKDVKAQDTENIKA